MPRFTFLLAIASLSFVVLSCTGSGSATSSDFPIGTYQSAGVLSGGNTSLQAVLDQGRPVVLNYWGGDCPPCRAEMPTLEDAWLEHGNDVVVLGVDIGPMMGLGTVAEGRALLVETGVTYPTGNSLDGSILENYNLHGLPATFFILPDGTINDSWPGVIASGPLRNRVRDLIEAHEQGRS